MLVARFVALRRACSTAKINSGVALSTVRTTRTRDEACTRGSRSPSSIYCSLRIDLTLFTPSSEFKFTYQH